MRRSVLFFTFALATIGCGSDPATESEADQEQSASDPAVETGVRPPAAIGMDQVARIERTPSLAAEQSVLVNRAAIETRYELYCPSPPLCAEVSRRQANER